MKLIENNIQKIIDLCKKHKVHKLLVFGSILTNRFNEKSDVDLIVDFNKAEVNDYFDNYFDFKYSLEDLLGRKVENNLRHSSCFGNYNNSYSAFFRHSKKTE